ncbi:DUF6498-containing protein [Tessaracoccus terricola]
MNTLLRGLGIGLLQSIAARISPVVATVVQFALILVGTLLPLFPLLSGAIGLPDLLVYTVLAMLLSIGGTVVRLRTMSPRSPSADFFTLHYSGLIGILCVVCGVWAVILLVMTGGPSGGWKALLPMAAALVLANAWSLADGWFIRGGRFAVRTWQVLLPGYLRFAPLLLATVFGAVAILGEGSGVSPFRVAVGLVVAQTVIDLAVSVASLLLARRAGAASEDERQADEPSHHGQA